ncbi:uncharacterized protein [Euwallacea fornicatus]|uniref:uncharacterized protein isoform X1 n=1 Tax=Euwallacea fornicatus TaxID=995702 RepID=UPI00338D55FA
MAMTRKLPNFRQFSLIAESPRQKRKPLLKKQFSEDIPDFKDPWFDKKVPPVKLAWGCEEDAAKLNEEVIIKKCNREIKRSGSGKLTRHASLEKDSILNSKQELLGNKENEKLIEAKPNLKIFLAHNISDSTNSEENLKIPQPKYLQPMLNTANAQLKIKKSTMKKPLDSPKAVDQKRPNLGNKTNTIVVVPLIENSPRNAEDSSSINVVIRPMTAQSRREKFQKRTNSAFNGNTSKEPSIPFRPPLVRSSSAPSIKPEKGKFVATKRRLKGKKLHHSPNLEIAEWKNAHSGVEVETMVSLISPSGSEDEEDIEEARPKSALKGGGKEETHSSREVSLRKTVKSVSFQQSSIHAVRSFSASFPARRGSMGTALTLPLKTKQSNAGKSQEKRGTNPGSPDADERVAKRRLLRNNTEGLKHSSAAAHEIEPVKVDEKRTISIDIHSKGGRASEELQASIKLDLQENKGLMPVLDLKEKQREEIDFKEEKPSDEPTCDTPKEKQCWEMYCKMTGKGINVSYDTILRGMLTPTEYRIRRTTSIAEEMHMMLNPPTDEDKDDEDPLKTL